MKKTLSRSLIASAVLVACGQLHAATAQVTATWSSTQGNADAAATNGAASVAMPSVTVKPVGTGYIDTDVVTVSYSAGSLRAASVGAVGDTINCTEGVGGAITFKLELTEIGTQTVKYKVTDRASTALTANTQCVIAGHQMLASSLTSTATVAFNWSAASASGTVHDVLRWTDDGNPASAINIHAARTQFAESQTSTQALFVSMASSSSGGYASRQRFTNVLTGGTITNNAGVTLTHAFTSAPATPTGYSGAQLNPIPGTGAATLKIVYTGDFSFLDNNSNGCTLADLESGWARLGVSATAGNSAAGGTTISSDCTTITTSAVGDRTEVLTFSVANSATTIGAKTIPAQTILISASWTTGAGVVLGTASDAAVIVNNNFSANIPYMPYGSGISRIIYATAGSAAGASVFFDATNESGTSCSSTNFPAVTVSSGRPTLLAGAIDQGVATCFGASYTGKVSINVYVNVAPQSSNTVSATLSKATAAANIGASETAALSGTLTLARPPVDLYTAYNVNGNRVTVDNTTTNR
jgi:hypothetical protein